MSVSRKKRQRIWQDEPLAVILAAFALIYFAASSKESLVQKGETLIDTAHTINAMGTDILVMRHSMSGAPHLIAPLVNASVINAGDGMDEHPTQALLDMLTIIEKKGSVKGLKIAIIGDIYHSRVVRGALQARQVLQI